MLEKFELLKKFVKIPPASLSPQIKMLGSNITITEEIVQMAKKCLNFNAQLIINKYNLSARLSLYENLI